MRGLRLFPRGTSAITAHRLTALASPQEIELYEYDSLHWRMRRIAISDAGNLETWLVSRREVDQALCRGIAGSGTHPASGPGSDSRSGRRPHAGRYIALPRPGVRALAPRVGLVRSG